ncbi:MAG: GEVED domain-containing protein [Flavobacteriales bacterium]|nr:GEVED domain-containing protein [Flavobacteriales bacterium]
MKRLFSLTLGQLVSTVIYAQNFTVVGTGTQFNTPYSYPAPFGNYYWGARQQFFYPASELLAAGLVPGASISSAGFNIISGNGAQVHYNFQITAYWTTSPLDPNYFFSGPPAGQTTPVNFPPGSAWPTGWQHFSFNTPFTWNGTDHLVIETCFQNSSFLENASTELTSLPPGTGPYSLIYQADMVGTCTNSSVNIADYALRPNLRLEWIAPPCNGQPSPGNTLASATLICPSDVVTLSVENVPMGTGVTYQWEMSTDGGNTWINVGTSTPVITYQPTVNASFRCVVTCIASGLSGTTAPVDITLVTDPCQCGPYPPSYPVFNTGSDIVNVTLNSFSQNSVCMTGGAPGSGSVAGVYSNYTNISSGPSAMQGEFVNFSVTVDVCDWASYSHLNIYADWNQDGDFYDSGELLYATTSPLTLPGTFSGTFMVPPGASPGACRLRVVASVVWSPFDPNTIGPDLMYDYGETEDYCFLVIIPPPCSGTPSPGQVHAQPSAPCVGQTISLSLPSLSPASGYTFQWEQSTDGGLTWTPFGPSEPMVTTTILANTQYRCQVTCANSGLSALSGVESVTVNPNLCQCLTYGLSMAQINWGSDIVQFSLGTLNQSGTCSDLAPGPGSQPGSYGNYTASGVPPVVYIGFPTPFTVGLDGCGGSGLAHFKMYADWNQDGDFDDLGEEVYATTSPLTLSTSLTQQIIPPLGALPGITRLRLIVQEAWSILDPNAINATGLYWYGETEDYCVEVQMPQGCTGLPLPGTTQASASSVCPNSLVYLSLPDLTPATGLSFQWQVSTNGGASWSNFGFNSPMAEAIVTQNSQFRCMVTCTNSGQSGPSTPVSVTVTGDFCICTPYAPSGALYQWDGLITQVTIGTMSTSSPCGTLAPGPGSALNTYSNYTTSVTGPSVMAGQSVNFSIEVGTCGGVYNNHLKIFCDWNQDGDFQEPDEMVYVTPQPVNPVNTITGSFTVPLTAVPGTTRLRIVLMETSDASFVQPEGSYAYGETEDYCFTVIPLPPCSGTPNPGNTVASVAEGCPFQPFNVQISNDLSTFSGITYQWQRSTDGGATWSNFGPSAPQVIAIQSVPTMYRCQVTCTHSNQIAFSTPLSVPLGTPCTCQNYGASGANSPDNTYIYQVKLGGLINNSTCYTLAPGPGSAVAQYSNYCGYWGPFEIESGKPVPFTVGVGTCNQGMLSIFKIFVDWNGDGDFVDNGEEVYTSPIINGGQAVSGIISTPSVSPLTTRLRIVSQETVLPETVTPTGSYNHGETEDYCVRILPAAGMPKDPEKGPEGSEKVVVWDNEIFLHWLSSRECGQIDFKVIDLKGKIVLNGRKSITGPGLYSLGRLHTATGVYVLAWSGCDLYQSQRIIVFNN